MTIDWNKKAEELADAGYTRADPAWDTAVDKYLAGVKDALEEAEILLLETAKHLAAIHLVHSGETTPGQDKRFDATATLLIDTAAEIRALGPTQDD